MNGLRRCLFRGGDATDPQGAVLPMAHLPCESTFHIQSGLAGAARASPVSCGIHPRQQPTGGVYERLAEDSVGGAARLVLAL